MFFLFHCCSARSKVKGHLQLYHAYISDPNQDQQNPSANLSSTNDTANQDPEPGWEMVDPNESGSSNGQAQVEQPARVTVC